MSTRPNFSARELEKVVCPPDKTRVVVRDTDVPGLCLFVQPTGARAFYWYRKVNGRPEQVRLGGFPELTVKQARELAAAKNNAKAQGRDPAAEKRRARVEAETRRENTLGALWTDYRNNYVATHCKPRSAQNFDEWYKRHLQAWENRPLAEVTEAEVDRLHKRIGAAHGHVTANRVMTLLSAMFRQRGRFFGLPKRYTPTADVERFPEQSRQRVLEADELPRFLEALAREPNVTSRDYLYMALYTGARRSNLTHMRWDDVSLQRAEWKVPGEMTKNGNPVRIPLVPEAVAILERRAETNPTDSPWVFPAPHITPEQVDRARALRAEGMPTRKIAAEVGISQTQVMRVIQANYRPRPEPGPLQRPRKALARVCKAAGISERVTLHDLRRTFITLQIRAGTPLPTVAASAGHRSMATTMAHYAIVGDADVRASVTAGLQLAGLSAKAQQAPQSPADASGPAADSQAGRKGKRRTAGKRGRAA